MLRSDVEACTEVLDALCRALAACLLRRSQLEGGA